MYPVKFIIVVAELLSLTYKEANAQFATVTEAPVVTVTGPVVDLYCWESRDGFSLDTNSDLKINPYNHTVHCLVEVEICRESGYAILAPLNQSDSESEWEILYKLDDRLNEKLIAEILDKVPVSSNGQRTQVGYELTISGIDDGTGYLRGGVVSVVGPLVDLYCWNDNNGFALDTGANLKEDPSQHTVHCLVEVDICKNSGYAILNLPDGNTEYEILYTLDNTLNNISINKLLALPQTNGTRQQLGYELMVTGFDSNDGILHNLSTIVTVTGPLVDLYCWDNRNGFSLDTNSNLKTNPYNHTVHCLVEVDVCRESGYVILNDTDNNGEWEVLYILDDGLNQLAIDQMISNVPGAALVNGSATQIGYEITITGIDDGSGYLRDLDATVTTTTTTTEVIASSNAGGGCSDDVSMLSAKGILDAFTIGIDIDCISETITVNITYNEYTDNWFGIVFADTMIGTSLIHTTGNPGNNEEERTLALYQYNNIAKSADQVQYDDTIEWTKISFIASDNLINIIYMADIDGSPVTIDQEEVNLRYAMGSDNDLTVEYHGSDGHSSSTLTLNLLTGGSIIEKDDMTLEYIHGIIMWITWAVLASFGIMSSSFRYLYPKGPKWFYVHRGIQSSVVIMHLIGFIIAVVFTQQKGNPHFNNPHMKIGLTVTILCILQPINALFRTHPPVDGWPNGIKDVRRSIWEFIHKKCGYSAWILGCVTAMLGMQLIGEDMLSYFHIYGWCSLLSLIYFILTCCNYIYQNKNINNINVNQKDKSYVLMTTDASGAN